MVAYGNGVSPAPKLLVLSDPLWLHIAAELRLSPQQRRVVAAVLRGAGDKHIAAELGVGLPTVRQHLTRIYTRNGLDGRVGLILAAFSIANAYWAAGPKRHHQR